MFWIVTEQGQHMYGLLIRRKLTHLHPITTNTSTYLILPLLCLSPNDTATHPLEAVLRQTLIKNVFGLNEPP